jgi:hypothetical protein
MTVLRALVAICCLLGPASIGPSQAQSNAWFGLSVCNASGVKNVQAAIASRATQNGNGTRVVGWYSIPDTGCTDLGTYWRDRVYIFAIAADTGDVWTSDATVQCVKPEAFDQTHNGNYNCGANEVAVGFMEAVASPNDAQVVFTLK